MYQSGQKMLDVVRDSSGTDRRKKAGAGPERPAKNGNGPATGILADAMAYGFNRELSTILSRLASAMAELPAGLGAREHIVAAMQAAERAGELNRQLLDHAGRERTDAQPLDLNGLIREKVQLLEIDRAPNLTVRLELADALPTVAGDSKQVQQAIGNLLTNAVEAIGRDSGRITVVSNTTVVSNSTSVTGTTTATTVGGGEACEDEGLIPGRYVTLQVGDDGCGMDEETQARMFAPFFSTKGVGRGLGLAAVLGVVRSHGGGIEVTSRPGEGTTVTVFFPVAGDLPDAAQPPEKPATASESGDGGRCVLVIDDELDVREAVTDILVIKGLDVLTAADGKSGLDLYREHREEVALVLLDLSMPKMGGEETCRRLREIDPGVRVLVTSGYDKGKTGAPLSRLEPDGFLPKPYDMQTLVDAVFGLLEEEERRSGVRRG